MTAGRDEPAATATAITGTAELPAALPAQRTLLRQARWRWYEVLFWLAVLGAYFAVPSRHLLMSEIAILGLFALSIDLILGYAGIISLGQGAFFGLGAYAAGLSAKYGAGSFPWSEPLIGLAIAGGVAGAVGFATSFLVLRGSDLTRLMVTLGIALIVAEAGNQMIWLTGGSDGLQNVMPAPVLGLFAFDLYGNTAFLYAVAVLFILFVVARAIVHSPFGLSLRAIKGNPLRARFIGIPVDRRLVAIYTIAAVYAGIAGGLLAQTTQFASLDMLAFDRSANGLLMLVFGGAGHLYGALVGAIVLRVLQSYLGDITPEYWEFWLGLLLVLLVLFARGGILGLVAAIAARFSGGKAQ